VHEVGVDFCNCGQSTTHTIQLLRARLFPATTQLPATAATFSVLKHFQLMSYESKTSAFQFYKALARETCNIDDDGVRVSNFLPLIGELPLIILVTKLRYREFIRMTRMWAHLKILKRSGRGHDPTGANGTKEGECAVLCPACPQPGINLPDGWRTDSKDR
jgi:hypothetical protein